MRRFTIIFTLLALLLTSASAMAQVSLCVEPVFVEGELAVTEMTEFIIAGDLTGDLEGMLETDIVESTVYELPWGTITYLQTASTITTPDGSLTTIGGVVLFPLGPTGDSLWLSRHGITEGTGAFEGAEGMLGAYGCVTAGELPVLSYGGVICLAP